jgi:hypothetical protein
LAPGLVNAAEEGSAQPGSWARSRSVVLLATGIETSLGAGTVETSVAPSAKGAARSIGKALGVAALTVGDGREATDGSRAGEEVARSDGPLGTTGDRMPVVGVTPAGGAAAARSARMALTSALCLSTGAFVTETKTARKTTCRIKDATMGRP